MTDLDLLHGLFFESGKGTWTLKVSIFRGRKLVSKRVRIRLETTDKDTAILKRDAILKGYRMIGLRIIQRGQRRPERDGKEVA